MAGSALTPPLQHGRYSLHQLVAAGGMATVHFGLQRGDDRFARIVAIKRLHGAAAVNPEFRDALRDEARVTSRIHHPNVVATLDVVEGENELWVVMEYIEGETLVNLRRLTSGIPMDPSLVATIAYGVLQGLHAAHEACDESGQLLHVVHRDISPQNIIIGTDGVPRVLDFGIAKAEGRVQSTEQGALKGKVAYMSPEQVWGKPIDRRADVFAASVVFWELLCGRKLHTNEQTDEAILAHVLQGTVETPSSQGIHLPPALEAVLMRGLAKNRDDRFPTAHAMALAIEEAVPLVTSRKLGAYVSEVAATPLAQRRATIVEVERAWMEASAELRLAHLLPPTAPASGAVPLFAPFVPSPAPSGESGSRALIPLGVDIEATALDIRRKRRRVGLWAAGIGVLLLLGVVLAFATSGSSDATVNAAASSTVPAVSASVAAVDPTVPTTPASDPAPPSVTTRPPTTSIGARPPLPGTTAAIVTPAPPAATATATTVPTPGPMPTVDKKTGVDCKRHPLVLDPKTKIYRVDPRCRSTLTGK
jgi:serine/threonine-protein kinase